MTKEYSSVLSPSCFYSYSNSYCCQMNECKVTSCKWRFCAYPTTTCYQTEMLARISSVLCVVDIQKLLSSTHQLCAFAAIILQPSMSDFIHYGSERQHNTNVSYVMLTTFSLNSKTQIFASNFLLTYFVLHCFILLFFFYDDFIVVYVNFKT